MHSYFYVYRLVKKGGEVSFRFHQLPEIISALPEEKFNSMGQKEKDGFAFSAVVEALKGRMAEKQGIPAGDDPVLSIGDGAVALSVEQSMKLEFYKVYRENCQSVAELNRRLGRSDTASRRVLDLDHNTRPEVMNAAFAAFGLRVYHAWSVYRPGG